MTTTLAASPRPTNDAAMTPDMMKLISEQRLGFVATVNANGTPNLSPKGSFVVVDPVKVAFGAIRSPRTLHNLAANPAVEVNFVDPFLRRGCRLFGTAQLLQRGTPEFDQLLLLFADYATLMPRIRTIVVIVVVRALPLTSPSYDDGASESELRRIWTDRFRSLQPGGQFVGWLLVGLLVARVFGWLWPDPLAGIIGASFIATWSYALVRDLGENTLDMIPDRGTAARFGPQSNMQATFWASSWVGLPALYGSGVA